MDRKKHNGTLDPRYMLAFVNCTRVRSEVGLKLRAKKGNSPFILPQINVRTVA